MIRARAWKIRVEPGRRGALLEFFRSFGTIGVIHRAEEFRGKRAERNDGRRDAV